MLIAIFLLSLGAVQSQQLPQQIYADLNAMCRGGRGDQQETLEACALRNKARLLLRPRGRGRQRQTARAMYNQLNVMCRGGSGDREVTNEACEVRGKVSDYLRSF